MTVTLKHGRYGDPSPFWVSMCVDGKQEKPVVRCLCGIFCELTGQAVDRRGVVSGTFSHACGWTAELRLKDYDLQAFS